jgi:hypothetical protein
MAAAPSLESPPSLKQLQGQVPSLRARLLQQALDRPPRQPPSMESLLYKRTDRPDQEAIALLKTIKGGYRQAGRGERIIWAGHITLITILGRPLGNGLMLTTTSANRGVKWRQICRWSDELTRTVCCPKTAPAQVLQVLGSNKIPAQRIRTPFP